MGDGVTAASASSIRLDFTYRGVRCREFVKLKPNKANLQHCQRWRATILHEIALGKFDYATHFPESKRVTLFGGSVANPTTVSDALSGWIRSIEPNVEHSTWVNYHKAVKALQASTLGGVRIGALSRQHILDWANDQTCTAKTIANKLTPLRQTCAQLAQQGTIKADPFHGWKLPRRKEDKRDKIDPLTQAEQAAIIAAAEPQIGNLIQFAFWSGLRTSELLGLHWHDVRPDSILVRSTRVYGREKRRTKTSAGARTVKLLGPAAAALDRQKQHTALHHAHVFHDPAHSAAWSGDAAWRRKGWIPAIEAAGVRYRNPYQTRHTYASMMLSAGEHPRWLADQMGHADWTMIAKVYARWMPEADPDAGDRAESIFWQ